MPLDKTGRNIHEGQLVDLWMDGIYTADVVKVIDHVLVSPDGHQMPPVVVVRVMLTLPIDRNHCPGLYVVGSQPKPVDEIASKPEPNLIQFPREDIS